MHLNVFAGKALYSSGCLSNELYFLLHTFKIASAKAMIINPANIINVLYLIRDTHKQFLILLLIITYLATPP